MARLPSSTTSRRSSDGLDHHEVLITAGIVILVSELAKRSDKLGGLVAALPLVTVVTLVWLLI